MRELKSALVISYGPVPTQQYQTIEGGGMRVWGLASGLRKNGVDVTVAIHESFPQGKPEQEGVKLVNWSIDTLGDLANRYDTVIMSYCMGEPSEVVARKIGDHVQLVLDAYVPIYVEISARKSEHVEQEYLNYMQELKRFDLALKRGDYFLCANETQKTFYIGVLSALGRINPITYSNDLIEILPFGVGSEPFAPTQRPQLPGVTKDDFVVLWFGGLYPWFDIRNLLKAVERLAARGKKIKLVVVGGRNPHNPNPVFFRQHDEAMSFAKGKGLLDTTMFFVDWVDFAKRANWFDLGDVVISINAAGQENRFSWRTRVMDFVWGERAIATNGGDPLSELLIEKDAAFRFESIEEDGLERDLNYLYEHPEKLVQIRKNLTALKPTFYWESLTAHLAKVITASTKAPDLTLDPITAQKLKEVTRNGLMAKATRLPVLKQVRQAQKLTVFVKRYGVRSSVKQGLFVARHVLGKRSTKRKYVFLSHPLDQTGGPLVLMEMIHEFAQQVGPKALRVVAPHIDSSHLAKLRKLGVMIDGMDPRLGSFALAPRLSLKPDDFVLMNTAAITANYREAILRYLADDRLGHAYWYVHEDDPQVQFRERNLRGKVHALIKRGKLTMAVPSIKMQGKYQKFFDAPIEIVPLHVDVPQRYKAAREAADYEAITFVLSGIALGGRKGQPTALFAFYKFLVDYYRGHESQYRNFKLRLIGLGKDYLSRQMEAVGQEVLGEHFEYSDTVSRDEALASMAHCNAVICCSLMEAFGLYVAEGMYMGHVVLRNDCSGVDEQLRPGVNGYLLKDGDLQQFADVIERMLNRSKTTNEQLRQMGQASQEMVANYARNNYYDKLMGLDRPPVNDVTGQPTVQSEP